jgi:hypothetical protein
MAVSIPSGRRQTAPLPDSGSGRFRITHPFHPLFSREFESRGSCWTSWDTEFLKFEDDAGGVRTIPRAFTDAADPDPFVYVSAGRSPFRVEDLVRLAELLEELKP